MYFAILLETVKFLLIILISHENNNVCKVTWSIKGKNSRKNTLKIMDLEKEVGIDHCSGMLITTIAS